MSVIKGNKGVQVDGLNWGNLVLFMVKDDVWFDGTYNVLYGSVFFIQGEGAVSVLILS